MTVKDDVTAFLSEEKHGTTLPSKSVTSLAEHLVDVAGIDNVKDIELSELVVDARAAWADSYDGQELPPIVERRIRKWIGDVPKAKALTSSRSAPADGQDVQEDGIDLPTLFGLESPPARDVQTLAQDKIAQGLSGVRIIQLAYALELGRVPAEGEVVGTCYIKGDPRLSPMAKTQRKAGVATLTSILASSDPRYALESHISSLTREYAERSMITEASLLTQWWSETSAVTSDDKALVEYIKEYFKKYRGRGLPVAVDVIISARINSSLSGGVSDAQLKDLAKAVKEAKNEAAEAKREAAETRRELNRMRNNRTTGSDQESKGPKCHHCGKFGHIARNCPEKAKNKSSEDAADEAAD